MLHLFNFKADASNTITGMEEADSDDDSDEGAVGGMPVVGGGGFGWGNFGPGVQYQQDDGKKLVNSEDIAHSNNNDVECFCTLYI